MLGPCINCNEHVNSGKFKNGYFICTDCYNMEQYENGVEGYFICPVCGRADSPNNWMGGLPNGFCFNCEVWAKNKNDYENGNRKIVVNGKMFHIGDETPSPPNVRGFAGAKFNIKKFTGEKIVSTNLWLNGEIPEIWRPYIPDNAEFTEY